MKAIEQYFPVLLFVTLCKVVQTTIQTKAIKIYLPAVLFIMEYNVALTFKSMNEILKCDHSNESY